MAKTLLSPKTRRITNYPNEPSRGPSSHPARPFAHPNAITIPAMPNLTPVQRRLLALQQAMRPSPLARIDTPLPRHHGVELWVKRDDLLHPVISGNKWRKLKYVLDDALAMSADTLVSMGGAYSNHLHALAYAGQCLGLRTVGLVRGEQPAASNPTLDDLRAWGMRLQFVPRTEYRELRQHKRWDSLPGRAPGEYWLPEGGAAALALRGVGEIVQEIDLPYDYLCTACGTGTTLAGLVSAAPVGTTVLGFAALKGAEFLHGEVAALLRATPGAQCAWSVNGDFHCGGFGRVTPALHEFVRSFEIATGIPVEPIYTGKLFFGLDALLRQGYFPPGTRIVALHTGGLQGKRR